MYSTLGDLGRILNNAQHYEIHTSYMLTIGERCSNYLHLLKTLLLTRMHIGLYSAYVPYVYSVTTLITPCPDSAMLLDPQIMQTLHPPLTSVRLDWPSRRLDAIL